MGNYTESLDCQKHFFCTAQGNSNNKLKAMTNIADVLVKIKQNNVNFNANVNVNVNHESDQQISNHIINDDNSSVKSSVKSLKLPSKRNSLMINNCKYNETVT